MKVTSEQLFFILENTPASQNIMLVGKHGIGKSRILEDFYSKKGLKVVTLFLGQMSDPGDLIGLPDKNAETGKTDFLLPYWFPTDGKPVVLFLDELNRARPELLQTVMDLTLNRKLAGKTLPEGSRIISAVNGGNEYQLTDLDPALVSRFNIYDFAPTVEEWLDWGRTAGIDERILAFIDNSGEMLDGDENADFAENLERVPDRRSWERLSEVLKTFEKNGSSGVGTPMVENPVAGTPAAENNFNIPNKATASENKKIPEELKILATGIVGDKAASLFFHFVETHAVLSAKKILEEGIGGTETPAVSGSPASAEKTGNTGNAERTGNASISESLLCCSASEITFLNTSLFANLRDSGEKNAVYSKHLEEYFDFLKKERGMEAVSHFCSLMSSSSYPKALVFISRNCPSLYQKVMDTISEM